MLASYAAACQVHTCVQAVRDWRKLAVLPASFFSSIKSQSHHRGADMRCRCSTIGRVPSFISDLKLMCLYMKLEQG